VAPLELSRKDALQKIKKIGSAKAFENYISVKDIVMMPDKPTQMRRSSKVVEVGIEEDDDEFEVIGADYSG
jgi:hypothetical protein